MQILAVPRLYGIQPKLTVALRITTNELHFVNYGRGLQQAVWLQYANENHGAIRQHALQRNMLSGEIIPREIRSFYKEGLVFIPAGDFDGQHSDCVNASAPIIWTTPEGRRAVR